MRKNVYIRLMHIQILVFSLLLNFPSKSGAGLISKEELGLHLCKRNQDKTFAGLSKDRRGALLRILLMSYLDPAATHFPGLNATQDSSNLGLGWAIK